MGFWEGVKAAVWPKPKHRNGDRFTRLVNLIIECRDGVELEFFRTECARRIGCTSARLREVLSAIADVAQAQRFR
jgi:hypothetical protein